VVDVALVVHDEDALAFALEEASLADDAFGTVHRDRLFSAELELCSDPGVVNDVRELVARLEFEDVDRTNVATVRASRALPKIDVDLNHASPLCALNGTFHRWSVYRDFSPDTRLNR
jgi:hypothetical protein